MQKYLKIYLTCLFILFLPDVTRAKLIVGPYLQTATPNSIRIMWETSVPDKSLVYWGQSSRALDQVTKGTSKSTNPHATTYIHHVQLTGLLPDTRYYYQLKTAGDHSKVYYFKTAPSPSTTEPFSFVVYSDNQIRPHIHKAIVEQGIIGHAKSTAKASEAESVLLDEQFAFVLVAGDIVSEGFIYQQYKQQYFDPMQALSAYVPYYPSIGNHEHYTNKKKERYGRVMPFYYDYMRLPDNGNKGFENQWYSFDYANVHIIGLDTNWKQFSSLRRALHKHTQINWLENDLRRACDNPNIDFIFAHFHHPYKSELWIDGEVSDMKTVIHMMEQALNWCDKAGGHFFGHAHGYSRGQSKDFNFYWINVGAAGGYLDYWGEWNHRDYDEFQKTYDEMGFVVVDVKPGDKPSFTVRRMSHGDKYNYHPDHNRVQDQFEFKLINKAPSRPTTLKSTVKYLPPSQKSEDKKPIQQVRLIGSEFDDPDKGHHLESEFEVYGGMDLSEPVLSKWIRFENIYNGNKQIDNWDSKKDVDTREGKKVNELELLNQFEPGLYEWRLRYRDSGLAWSEWSELVRFEIKK